MFRRLGQGPDLAVIAHPSGPSLHLSLWIDAGARDADPPQVATLAAWLAAEAGGRDLSAQVFPDGIELSVKCEKRELRACLGRLQRALSLRSPAPARVAGARARLSEARRAVDASDPARAADRLALEALCGEDTAAGLFPLGDPAEDGEADDANVADFLARHFGPQRALLSAVGEIDADDLAEAGAVAFARARPATAARASERGLTDLEGGVAVEVADATVVSLALAAPSLEQAHALADAFKTRIERDRHELALRGAVRGHVFALRGGALALLRVRSPGAAEVTRSAAHELERLRRERLPPPPTDAPPTHDPRVLGRRLGLRWAARTSARASAPLALGAGVLVAGGRADRLSQKDPDAAQRERARDQLQAAFADGRAQADPELHGEIDARAAQAKLDNGARIEVRARASEHMAVAVRFARGAASEPPLLHGRAALLATLAATACAGLSSEQLAVRLHELGADLQPSVEAGSWGIVLRAPSKRWQAATALALDCALHPGLERRHLSTARLRLVQRLGPEGGAGELQAAAAEQLWPSAPGALAPWGSPQRQASVSLAAVRELWSESRRGPSLSVAIVGALPADEAAAWAARRVAALDGQSAAVEPTPPPLPAQRPAIVDRPTLGLAIWRVQGAAADPAGAQGFAALMRATLAQVPGVAAIWHGGGVIGDGGWAAVGLSGAPEPLAGAAAALRDAARALAKDRVTRAADHAFELGEQARAAAAAEPLLEAEARARAAFENGPATPSLESARALANLLSQAEPLWLPLR
jgi:predicted Zn-dependent peptidase